VKNLAANSLGQNFVITSFGESHGKVIGIIVDGTPAGLELDIDFIQSELNMRRPGQSKVTTSRKEKDQVEVLSGIFKGKTTGAPICLIIRNEDINSSKYEKFKDLLRPSQVDYSALKRYGGFADYRGSGRFSGRNTAGFVMAGAIAKQLLKKYKIEIFAYTKSIGTIYDDKNYDFEDLVLLLKRREESTVRTLNKDNEAEMINLIQNVKGSKDSIGGTIKCIVKNVPAGIGNPIFNSLESSLSHAIFSIPAIKGIEFGAGFKAAEMKGSEHNDPWILKGDQIQTSKNDCGGIIGGISIGMPIEFTLAIKPTATIGKIQDTVNVKAREETTVEMEGRHDPCIVPRAVVVVEAMTAIVLVDHLITQGYIKPVLNT